MSQEKKPNVVVREEPEVDAEEVWEFYVENGCCEQRYGCERATSVLRKSDIIVTARDQGKLVGLARAITDGIDACIMELSVALSCQGRMAKNQTGALVEDDKFGVGRGLAKTLIDGLLARGICFIEVRSVYETETEFYKAAGFSVNTGHVPMYVDQRPPCNA
jgi:hypothetical protein